MVQHNALTGSSLHEPKGISTALNGTVYQANGAGSGSWVALGSLPTGAIAGDLIVNDGSNWNKLSAGTANYVLTSNGAGSLPTYKVLPTASGFGSRVTSLQNNITYTASTDGFLCIQLQTNTSFNYGGANFYVYSDSSSPPTTEVLHYTNSAQGEYTHLTVPIYKSMKYKMECINTDVNIISASFVPLG